MERRVRRSAEPRKALKLLLEAARERLALHAVAVSTRSGWLVAGSGEGAILLAALGARTSVGEHGSVSIAKLDEGHLLTALGAGAKPLDDLTAGVRRILAC
jgi:hypothetical protein